jgi:acetate kinase
MPVLVLNCGSSSIKYTLYDSDHGKVVTHGDIDRVEDYQSAFDGLFSELEVHVTGELPSIRAVGHRVVHGGRHFTRSCLVDDEIMVALMDTARLAPLHNPHNLKGIQLAAARIAGVPQIAVFDTAFHATLPDRARYYAIPTRIAEIMGIRRYGFHGISHQYVSQRAAALVGKDAGRNIITCHLGNGCSITAVKDGRSIETSMGFTPLEGLVMGTRSGDIDPTVALQLLDPAEAGLTLEEVYYLLNNQSGLLGLSGISPDVRDLLKARDEEDDQARLALEIFTYRLKKYIGSYHALLGGADVLVFTAGIGENSPRIRAEALEGMEGLGFVLDPEANGSTVGVEGEISGPMSQVRILVIPTDEDRLIYEETVRMIQDEDKVKIKK